MDKPKNSIAGFILAGGASSRMGTDKAQLTFAGQTFLERIAGEMSQVVSTVAIVGKGSTHHHSLKSVTDVYEGWGALGGVHAALAVCASPWALIVACDLPFLTASLFTYLAGLREGFGAVAPTQSDGRPQPLCALYRVSSCLERADQLIKSGERRPIALLQSIDTRWVTFDELCHLEGSKHFFDNINTPQDYARLHEEGGNAKDVVARRVNTENR